MAHPQARFPQQIPIMRDFSPFSWLSSSTGDTTMSNPAVIATGLIEPVLLASDGATLFINTSVPMGPLLTSVPVEGGAMWRFQVVSLFRTRGRRGADFAKL